jgi:hypothetical protein
MPLSWKFYRIVCILQMVSSSIIMMSTLFRSFQYPNFTDIARLVLFLLILLLAIFAINTLNNNYPETPITGPQKRTFNRLFLLNFIFLAVLFGFIIAGIKSINELAVLLGKPVVQLPFTALMTVTVYIVTLVFQFIILYGLYNLRRILYSNFMKQEFEFEGK